MIDFSSLPVNERLYTAGQMRLFDEKSINDCHTPSMFLMGNAGQSIAFEIMDYMRDKACGNSMDSPIVIICGKGNNGGDGAAAAIWLKSLGMDSVLFLTASSIEEVTPDSSAFFSSALEQGIGIITLKDKADFLASLSRNLETCTAVADCMLGTGIKGFVKGIYKEIIDLLNKKTTEGNLFVVSADIPSGVSCDTGAAGSAVRACSTLCFGAAKPGLYIWPGLDFAGQVKVVPICLAPLAAPEPFIFRPQITRAASVFRFRNKNDHKGKCGKALIIGGSSDYPGAMKLACLSAVKGGPGYVSAVLPESARQCFSAFLPEVVTPDINDFHGDKIKELIKNADVVAIGPGMGIDNEISHLPGMLLEILKEPGNNTRIIMDADALNIIALDRGSFGKRVSLLSETAPGRLLFTPHPGEMSRLTGLSVKDILADPIKICIEYASQNRVNILLKGVTDILASPQGKCAIIDQGHQCVARAGTGDVLTGIIAAFSARGMTVFDSAWMGAWFVRKAAEKASVNGAGEGLRISGLPQYFDNVFQALHEYQQDKQKQKTK